MRRFTTLVALLVLSLSRFGVAAPAPARASASVERGYPRELHMPAVRIAAVGVRAAAPRILPRAGTHWLPFHGAQLVVHALPLARRPDAPLVVERVPLGASPRVTYDATAPPRFS